MKDCPFWSDWTNYSECSAPCGGGVRSRSRVCVTGKTGDVGCEGPAFEEDFCNGYVSKKIVTKKCKFHAVYRD